MGNFYNMSGKPVGPAETRRSGLGKLLSDTMPGMLSASFGDIGIRYDRLSRGKKAGALLGALAVLGGGLFVGAEAVEGAFDLSGNRVAAYQERTVVGPHALVTFTSTDPDRYIWGYPNTDGGNPIFGRVPKGAEIACAPVIGNMAFVQKPDGIKGFVSFDPEKASDNPDGCPDSATVIFDSNKNQYSLVDANGASVNSPVGKIREP